VARSNVQKHVPRFIEPMAARLVDRLPEGDEWSYEVKFDGYRALLLKNGGAVQIRSRNNKDLTLMYPSIRSAGQAMRAETAVLDGEVVAVDAHGQPSFQALQHRSAHPGHSVVFFAFDLLQVDGHDLTGLAIEQRRAQLPAIVDGTGILLSEELRGTTGQIIEAVRAVGLEGVVAKRKGSRYEAGLRTGAWQKLKLDKQQEFVVGGYRPGTQGIDALLVGFFDKRQLRFAGKVRAGFTPHLRREVFAALASLHSSRCPFVDLPNSKTSHWGGGVTAEQMGEMQWLAPKAVAQIRFVEWTTDRHLRHAAFIGLRLDRDASKVKYESASSE
jgi:DNA ligase D-like protein (predicted ligase)